MARQPPPPFPHLHLLRDCGHQAAVSPHNSYGNKSLSRSETNSSEKCPPSAARFPTGPYLEGVKHRPDFISLCPTRRAILRDALLVIVVVTLYWFLA